MKRTAAIYHWWGFSSDASPIANLRSPIIASIATLRAVNEDIKIYVIDVSDQQTNWGDYPSILNFDLHCKSPYLKKNYSDKQGFRNLSRFFDMIEFQKYIEEDDVLYVDSDVFFLQNPLPFEQTTDKFCFNMYNSGYFYYNKKAPDYLKFEELFKAYATTALNDESFRYITKQFGSCDDYFVLDETLMHYMYIKHREIFNVIQPTEHFVASSCELNLNPNEIKMFHANGTLVNNPFAKHEYEKQHSRGLICLGIQELYHNLCQALKDKHVNKMFTTKEREAYLDKQMPFDVELEKKLVSTKTESGHYMFSEAIGVV